MAIVVWHISLGRFGLGEGKFSAAENGNYDKTKIWKWRKKIVVLNALQIMFVGFDNVSFQSEKWSVVTGKAGENTEGTDDCIQTSSPLAHPTRLGSHSPNDAGCFTMQPLMGFCCTELKQ